METKLEYLLDSGNILNVWDSEILKQNISVTWVFAFQNTLLNIGHALHCNVGNDIFFMFVSAMILVHFSDLLGFKYAHLL